MCDLQNVGIQSFGTVLPNRIPNIGLPSEGQRKKKGRGCVEERATLVCGQRVRDAKYFNKGFVMFFPTYASVAFSREAKI